MTDAVQNETVQEASTPEENKLIAERRAKLEQIRKSCKANGHQTTSVVTALLATFRNSSVKRAKKSWKR